MPSRQGKGQRAKGEARSAQSKSSQHKKIKAKTAGSRPKAADTQPVEANKPRRLQMPARVWYKPLTWRNHPPAPEYKPLPKAGKILTVTLRQLWANWKLFGGIALTYGLLNILLVRGLSGSSNLGSFKTSLDSVFHGVGGTLASSATSFIYLLGTSGSGNTTNSGVYQGLLLIVCSLAFIWALRQTLAKHRVRMRDSFYQGMYPLVPFLLLFLIVGLQLLPLAIGGGLYSTVVTGGIAVHIWEKALWLLLFIVLGLWSLRMVTASVLAVYIVTLPDMTPFKALRSAKQLVTSRRLLIWRKLIFLPFALLLAAAIIELPLILFATVLAPWVFFVFSTLALALTHGYLYNLYREML